MTWINTKSSLKKSKPKYDTSKYGGGKSSKYYNSQMWKNLRLTYIRDHPLCELCLKKGIVREAKEIHHRIPFLKGETEDDRWNYLLDYNNLMALCYECHDEIHRQMKRDSY